MKKKKLKAIIREAVAEAIDQQRFIVTSDRFGTSMDISIGELRALTIMAHETKAFYPPFQSAVKTEAECIGCSVPCDDCPRGKQG